MKAISIKQPWAWAIANGHKTIETRTWPTKYRGEILIVASKTPDRKMLDWFEKEVGSEKAKELLEYGKALCVANLTDCRLMTKADEDAAMCDVYDRAHAWLLEDIRKLEKTFPVKGQLGIYEVEMPE